MRESLRKTCATGKVIRGLLKELSFGLVLFVNVFDTNHLPS